jgi:outer membrane lipoprotein-sorting protein
MRHNPLPALLGAVALAASAEVGVASDRGREIARAMHEANAGFGDESVRAELTITSADGTKAERAFRMVTLERIDAGDKRAVIFSKPASLDGFVSLNHTKINAPDNQWIYLPRLNTTRRLASRNKSGSLAGSDFTYEDILRFELARYAYEYVGKGACGNDHTCQKVAFDPRYEYSAYSKLIQFIDTKIMRPRRITYYDKTGEKMKTLQLRDFKQYGDYWRSHEMTMKNHRNDSTSVIRWKTYHFNTGLRPRDFSVQRIKGWTE